MGAGTTPSLIRARNLNTAVATLSNRCTSSRALQTAWLIASLILGILWLWWLGSVLALIFGYVAKNQELEPRARPGPT